MALTIPPGARIPIAHAPPAPPTAFRPSPQRTLQDPQGKGGRQDRQCGGGGRILLWFGRRWGGGLDTASDFLPAFRRSTMVTLTLEVLISLLFVVQHPYPFGGDAMKIPLDYLKFLLC